MCNIWVAPFKSLPLTCSCTVTHSVFFLLCIQIEESLAGILSVGLSSNMLNWVWSDLCDCWNVDLTMVAYWQLYFLLKSSIACCTCCKSNTTLKQEVTLIYTRVHQYWDFYWGHKWSETTFPAFAFPIRGASGGAGNGLLEFSGKLIVRVNPEKEFPFLLGLLGMQWTIEFVLATYHLHFIFVLFTDFPPAYVLL